MEMLIVNLPTTFGGVLLSGAHVSMFYIAIIPTLLSTLTSHSGWHLPLIGCPEGHDYHHRQGFDNLGTTSVFDRIMKTNLSWEKSWQRTGCDRTYHTVDYPLDKIISSYGKPPVEFRPLRVHGKVVPPKSSPAEPKSFKWADSTSAKQKHTPDSKSKARPSDKSRHSEAGRKTLMSELKEARQTIQLLKAELARTRASAKTQTEVSHSKTHRVESPEAPTKEKVDDFPDLNTHEGRKPHGEPSKDSTDLGLSMKKDEWEMI